MQKLLASPMPPPSAAKARVLDAFASHVSPGKRKFYDGFGMTFVMGAREGPLLYDMDATPGPAPPAAAAAAAAAATAAAATAGAGAAAEAAADADGDSNGAPSKSKPRRQRRTPAAATTPSPTPTLPRQVDPRNFSLYNLHCNGGVFNLGHRHPAMMESLRRAMEGGPGPSTGADASAGSGPSPSPGLDIGNHHLVSSARAALGERLAALLPGDLRWTVFGVSGGEAVDLALKMAYGHTGRSVVVVATGAYHGNTGLSVRTGDAKFLAPFGMTPPSDDVAFVRVPFGDAAALEAAMGPDVAACMFETVPATLGMVVPPGDYFARVRRLCDDTGAVFICDEVQTGMGRSGGGKLWAIEHYLPEGTAPDIMVMGKGLSGGVYPLSVTCFRPHLAYLFEAEPFAHVSTFGGSEIGCRVTLDLLDITAAPAFSTHVDALAAEWERCVASQLVAAHPDFVVGLRRLGLFMGLKLCDDSAGPVMTKAAFDVGVLLIYAANDTSVVQLLPPLNMPLADVPVLCDRLAAACVAAKKLLPLYKAKTKAERLLPFLKRKGAATPRARVRGGGGGSGGGGGGGGGGAASGSRAGSGEPWLLWALSTWCGLCAAAWVLLHHGARGIVAGAGGGGDASAADHLASAAQLALSHLPPQLQAVAAKHDVTNVAVPALATIALVLVAFAVAKHVAASVLVLLLPCGCGRRASAAAGRSSSAHAAPTLRLPEQPFVLSDEELRRVEATVSGALDAGRDDLPPELPVLGYGEVSVVLKYGRGGGGLERGKGRDSGSGSSSGSGSATTTIASTTQPTRRRTRRSARQASRNVDADADADSTTQTSTTAVDPALSASTPVAVKRLAALFDLSKDDLHLRRYEHIIAAYLQALESAGVRCVPTALQSVPTPSRGRGDGTGTGSQHVAYLVQPLYPPERMLPRFMASAPEPVAVAVFMRLMDVIVKATGALGGRLGVDGQLSNWLLACDPADVGDGTGVEFLYLDNSTPFLKDRSGNEMLDLSAFLVTFPLPIRVVVNTFLLQGIIGAYYAPRTVVLDCIANCIKEGLERLVPPFVAAANARGDLSPPLTVAQVKSYYADDARMYAALQWARRADRWVRRNVLRGTYPFLLPPPIQR